MDQTFVSQSIECLKSAGYRITQPRRYVLELLANAKKPLNANQIHQGICKKSKAIDLVSVYRIIETFLEHGIIHKDADTGGYFPCTHCPNCPEDIHIFLKCTDCQEIRELDYHGEVFSPAFKKQLNKADTEPLSEIIYLNDLCANCS